MHSRDMPTTLRVLARHLLAVADAMDSALKPAPAKAGRLNPPNVARELGVPRAMVQRWCRLGRVGKLVGKRYVLTREEVETIRKHLRGENGSALSPSPPAV
jgi:hypothetical protein